MATTTSAAKPSSSQGNGGDSAFNSLMGMLVDMLRTDFPDLYQFDPDLRFKIMALWNSETSLGKNIRNVDVNNTSVVTRAINSFVFKNLQRSLGQGLQAATEIGFTHGIGQVIGVHHIRGLGNELVDSPYPTMKRMVRKYQLEVLPSQMNTSITNTVYSQPVGDLTGFQRGMAASIGVLYHKWRARGRDLNAAIGSYLGVSGTSDKFGTTPEAYRTKILAVAAQYKAGKTQAASTAGSTGSTTGTSSTTTAAAVAPPGC